MIIQLLAGRRRGRWGIFPAVRTVESVGSVAGVGAAAGVGAISTADALTVGSSAGVGTATGIGGTDRGVGTTAGVASVFGVGSNGSAEGPHDFFTTLQGLGTHLNSWALRTQTQLDTLMVQPSTINIISSTAAAPTVITCGYNSVNITSSLDGLITCSGAHSIPSTPSYTIEVTGHSLATVNGVKEVSRVSSTQLQILNETITGSGTGGKMYRSDHRTHDGALIVMTGHGAIANGTYAATRLDSRRLELRTITGEPVTSSGGGEVGTFSPKSWEHFASNGRTNPESLPQDAACGKIPVYQGADIPRQLWCDMTPSADQSWLVTWDFWQSTNMRQDLSGPKVASKTFRWDHTGGQIQYWSLYSGRSLNIGTASAGNPTSVTTDVEHYFTTGDSVAFSGSGSVPDGSYVVTVTGSKSFTIPISTGSGSAAGTVTHSTEVDRSNITFGTGWSGFHWLAGYTESADNRTYPTGENGLPMAAGYFGSFPVYGNRWTRAWMYLEGAKVGDDFTSWNSAVMNTKFPTGQRVGKWNCSVTVDGSGVGTVTCLDGPHGYAVNRPVIISGITGVSGTYTIASIPATPTAVSTGNGGFTGPTTFTITGATPGASGSGIMQLRLCRLSLWMADEVRNPTCVFDGLPVPYFSVPTRFRHEYDSSNDEEPMANAIHHYARNTVLLQNPSNVTLSNTTLFKKPVG